MAEGRRIYAERSRRSSQNPTSISSFVHRPFDFAQGTRLSPLAEGRRIYVEFILSEAEVAKTHDKSSIT